MGLDVLSVAFNTVLTLSVGIVFMGSYYSKSVLCFIAFLSCGSLFYFIALLF